MNPLIMNERITIQNYEVVKIGGVQYQQWTDKATVWARVFTVRASEFYAGSTEQSEEVLRFVTRPISGLEITSAMRVKFNNLAYDIKSAINDDYQNETLTIVTRGLGEEIEDE